jgi:catechol 2,3-dioxygenase-like lactoylglutathione lyase family enzyme
MPHPIQVRGIDHVVLRVADMERSIRFYREALGCSVEYVNEPLKLVHVRAGTAQIDLVDLDGPLGKQGGRGPGAEARNMDHFCVRIEAFDIDALKTHLSALGVTYGEPLTRFGADGVGPSLYLTDPDGNTVELKGPPTHPGPLASAQQGAKAHA